MSHRGQSHLKTITRARPVSLKPPIQHLLCIGTLKGACTRRLFNSLFFWHLKNSNLETIIDQNKKDLKSITSKPERVWRCRSPQELREEEEESASDH